MTRNAQVKARWAPVVALASAMPVVTAEMTVAAVVPPSPGGEMGVGPAATAWVLPA